MEQDEQSWTTCLWMSLITWHYVTVRKVLYTSLTLSSFQRSFDWHMTKELHKPLSLHLSSWRSKGKVISIFAAESPESFDVWKLWDEGGLGQDDPDQLQQTTGLLISTHMGTNGHDEHHGFQFGDFTKSSPDVEYVGLIIELGAKTRSGKTVNLMPYHLHAPTVW